MRRSLSVFTAWASVLGGVLVLPGCATTPHLNGGAAADDSITSFAAGVPSAAAASYQTYVRILGANQVQRNTVAITTRPVAAYQSGEDILDLASPDGVSNYIASAFPRQPIERVLLKNDDGRVFKRLRLAAVERVSPSVNASAATFARGQHIDVPPPGVTIDPSVKPEANPETSRDEKTAAVVSVAEALIDQPYIWGHNVDRGMRGFDSGNFVAYVYHHALGYRMSGSSHAQWNNVGVTVPIWDMQKGDLLIFEDGRHVGIYLGNNEMIQAGGGLGAVGVVSLGPESYWGKQLTTVRRLY